MKSNGGTASVFNSSSSANSHLSLKGGSGAGSEVKLRGEGNVDLLVIGGSQTALIRDTTASTGDTNCIIQGGAGQAALILDVKNNTGTSRFGVNETGVGFYATTPVAQPASAADLTNNVTAGGTNDTIDDWADLSTYATDAAAIRNAVHQLARKLKQVNDGLRDLGLLT